MMTKPGRPNISSVLLAGLIAGLMINLAEYLIHGILLDPQWTAAFAALGKKPTGWTTFIPSNFIVGVIGIWVYAKFSPNYGPGVKTALRSALSIWAVFWVIPMMALQPLDIFPNSLIFATILAGFLDSTAAVLLGATVYRP